MGKKFNRTEGQGSAGLAVDEWPFRPNGVGRSSKNQNGQAAKGYARGGITKGNKLNKTDIIVGSTKKYYPFLDGFRAIAILMILSHHISTGFDLGNIFSHNPALFNWVYLQAQNFGVDLTHTYVLMQDTFRLLKGILGVEMFFVISGFLIAGILLRNKDRGIPVSRFYQRRFWKIFPSYFILVVVSLAIFAWQAQEPFEDTMATAFRYLFFVQNYFPSNPFLEHTWTLAVMEQFYFFCPLVIAAVYFFVKSAEERRAALIGLCLLLLIVGPVIRLYYLSSGETLLNWPFQSPAPYSTTFYHIDALAFGCLLALLEPYWTQWKKNIWWGCGLWTIGAGLYFYLFFILDWSYYWGTWYLYTLGYVATGLLILAAYHGVSLLARFKFLQWVGRHSYGIYLWHYILMIFWKTGLGKVPLIILIFSYLLATLLLGVLSTKTIERYFLSLREKLVPSV